MDNFVNSSNQKNSDEDYNNYNINNNNTNNNTNDSTNNNDIQLNIEDMVIKNGEDELENCQLSTAIANRMNSPVKPNPNSS